MLNFDLLKQVLVIAIASGCVTTLTIQKIKEQLTNKSWIYLASFLVSMVIGTLFAKSFSDISFMYSLWCGFFTFIDADLLYKTLEDKVFTKYSDMEKVKKIERDEE